MQVDVLAQVLKYLRTSTHVEKVNARHEHNMALHIMSLNRRAESFTS